MSPAEAVQAIEVSPDAKKEKKHHKEKKEKKHKHKHKSSHRKHREGREENGSGGSPAAEREHRADLNKCKVELANGNAHAEHSDVESGEIPLKDAAEVATEQVVRKPDDIAAKHGDNTVDMAERSSSRPAEFRGIVEIPADAR
jgi:hypothetical protein